MKVRTFSKLAFHYTPFVIMLGCVVWTTYVFIQMEQTASDFKCMQNVFTALTTTPGPDAEANKRQRNVLIQQIHLQCNVEVDLEH